MAKLESLLYLDARGKVANSRLVEIYGKIGGDALLTMRQLIPNNTEIGISLERSSDRFILASPEPGADYRIKIQDVSVFLKRVEPNSLALERLNARLAASGGNLLYRRLDHRSRIIPKGSNVFQWSNIWGGQELPKAFFMVLIKEKAVFGDYKTIPYFESANVNEVEFSVDGTSILPEGSYRSSWHYTADGLVEFGGSHCHSPFMGLHMVTNAFFTPYGDCGIDTRDWMGGCTIWAALPPKAYSPDPDRGSFDLKMRFGDSGGSSLAYQCLVFGTVNEKIQFDGNRTYEPIY